jgi:hypothetical protein
MLATVVETQELLKTIAASVIAGVGITASFSLVIFGTVRASALARDERPVLAVAAGALAALALAVTIAGIVVGLLAMASK